MKSIINKLCILTSHRLAHLFSMIPVHLCCSVGQPSSLSNKLVLHKLLLQCIVCTCVSGFCGCFWCNVFFVGVSCPGNSTSDGRGVAFSGVGGAVTANCSSSRAEFAQYTRKLLNVF